MTGITLDTVGPGASGLASWIRRLFVVFAVVVLVALSFAIGRATMGHAARTTTTTTQAAVQPAVAPNADHSELLCHGPRHPC